MPNKNYIKGRVKEYRTCEKLRQQGFTIAQRSAGSHSPIDIFAIHKEKKIIKFVQCKPDNFLESAKKKIEEELNYLNGDFKVEFELI